VAKHCTSVAAMQDTAPLAHYLRTLISLEVELALDRQLETCRSGRREGTMRPVSATYRLAIVRAGRPAGLVRYDNKRINRRIRIGSYVAAQTSSPAGHMQARS
jgi:hypothetical protein